MLRRDYEGQEPCSVAWTLELVGERWTWLIVRDAFLGLSRFAEFERSLGIARNVLAARLARLVGEGIFERVPYSERPPRFEYRLTEKGLDLFTALNALRQWGDRHLSPSPMRLLRRRTDGRPVVVALVPEGTPSLGLDDVELVPGPGFPRGEA
jgi:DNA-binding HxlR family transcriptional regulator